MIERPGIRHRVYWGAFLGTWAALAFVIQWHVRGLDAEVKREGLANAAVVACRNVLVDMVDVETGLRGHLILGRREFLRPYHEGLGRIEVDMAVLRTATAGLPDERSQFEAIVETSKSVLGEFSNQVAVVESHGIEAGRKRFEAFPTKPGMDRIRACLMTIQVAEDTRFAANMRSLEVAIATTLFLLNVFGWVLVIVLVSMATGFVSPPGSDFDRGVSP